MSNNNLIEDLFFELQDLGYKDTFTYKQNAIHFAPKQLILQANDLFFIDGIYKVNELFFILINAPIYSIKGVLQAKIEDFKALAAGNFIPQDVVVNEFNEKSTVVKIKRQYNMRKVLLSEFEADRYILKQGFPDFPPCPYGHTFKQLGFDTEKKEYVRLAPAILKKKEVKTIKFKE